MSHGTRNTANLVFVWYQNRKSSPGEDWVDRPIIIMLCNVQLDSAMIVANLFSLLLLHHWKLAIDRRVSFYVVFFSLLVGEWLRLELVLLRWIFTMSWASSLLTELIIPRRRDSPQSFHTFLVKSLFFDRQTTESRHSGDRPLHVSLGFLHPGTSFKRRYVNVLSVNFIQNDCQSSAISFWKDSSP